MNINTIHQWAGDAALIFDDRAGRTGAGMTGVAIVAAGARVHGSHELKISREGKRALGAADGDHFVFERLAQHFQHSGTELRQLIQKENAAVGQADLTGMWPIAAPNETGMTDGVVRGAERTVLDERHAGRQGICH